MKWVTILSFVVVLSLTESRILQKRGHQEGHHEGEKPDEGHHHLTHTVAEAYKILGKDHFEEVALVVFSQLLPKCPYEEHVQRVKDVEDIAEKCSKGIKTAECGKSVATILVDEICKKPENEEKYPYHKECCAKEEHAREECFVSHKLTDPDALPPYVKRDPEEKCKEFKEHKDTFLGHYIYELARRKPQMYAPAILSFEHHYEEIASDCCKDPAHTAECFTEKMPAHKKQLKIAYAIQQHSCYIRKNFGERPLSALKLSQISQKMPKASFENIHEIVHGVVHLTESCCSGDMMECMADRLALSNKVCEKKDELSSKLKECCDKDVIERSECIVMLEPDEKPADLSPEVREFIDDAAVCQKYKDEKDQFLAKYRRFVYQTGDLQNRKWLNWMPDFDMSKDRHFV